MGQLGAPDSAIGQVNTGATVDPTTLRPDFGTVNPLSIYSFGGDWTPSSALLVNARYGYFFSNNSTRGTPTGIRYVYDRDLNAATRDAFGNPFPANAPDKSEHRNHWSAQNQCFLCGRKYSCHAMHQHPGLARVTYSWLATRLRPLRLTRRWPCALTWSKKATRPTTSPRRRRTLDVQQA